MDEAGIQGTSAAEIVESVRGLVGAGRLTSGSVLPPIRGLAAGLGVNRNTVAAAYAQLAAAGIVQTRRRGGTVVLGVPIMDGEGQHTRDDLVNLASGNPAPEFLPEVTASFLEGYTPPLYGHPPVSARLRAWAERAMSPDVAGEAHELVLAHGAVDAVERLLTAHLTRGDAIAVEDPCFLSSIGTMRLNGYRSVPVAMDTEGMVPEALASALTAGVRAIVCTPRSHNPTGATVTPERAARLREILARQPKVLVIEDDHFSAIAAKGYHRITPPDAPHWALVRSVSKFLGPDLRLAFVLADPDSAARMATRLSPASSWVSHLLQHIVASMLEDESVARLLARARTGYAERHRSLIDALGHAGIVVPPPGDGLNVWIPVAGKERQLMDALAVRGWAVRAGTDFAVTDRTAADLRVTTATITAHHAGKFAADLANLM